LGIQNENLRVFRDLQVARSEKAAKTIGMDKIEAKLRDEAALAMKRSYAAAPVVKLKGDASSRSYFRVGEGSLSVVVMVMPLEMANTSDEITRGQPSSELPFVNVHRYLQSLRVRVPHIYRYDASKGFMVLEDLSDETFEKSLSTETLAKRYQQAVRLLAKLRYSAEQEPDASCLAFSREFDAELYNWELHHFRECGMEVWSRQQPSADERGELDTLFLELSKELAAAPKGFTHRDYQSRNIMVKNGELIVIDFQDALQGPRQYDLVALLRDSYVELPSELVDAMLDEYIVAFEKVAYEKIDAKAFKDFFTKLTVQRKLKDAGRFQFINDVKKNDSFLVSIPTSLRYVKAAFEALPELSKMRRIVSKYVQELS
jgi:N-acetylmuramate 1-kinase